MIGEPKGPRDPGLVETQLAPAVLVDSRETVAARVVDPTTAETTEVPVVDGALSSFGDPSRTTTANFETVANSTGGFNELTKPPDNSPLSSEAQVVAGRILANPDLLKEVADAKTEFSPTELVYYFLGLLERVNKDGTK